MTSSDEMTFDNDKKRSEQRHAYFTSVEFTLKSEKGETLLVGTAINLSDSGLGIYSHVPLTVGQEITVRNAFPIRNRTYTVRWTDKLLEDFFVVGLKQKEEPA